MKRLTFSAWETPTDESFKVWILLWQAVNNPDWKPSAKDQWRMALAIVEGFEKVIERKKLDNGNESVALVKSGGSFNLEDAPFGLLKMAWDSFANKLPLGMAKDVVTVEKFLEDVPEVKV